MFPTNVVQSYDPNGNQQQTSAFGTNSFNMIMPLQPQSVGANSTLVNNPPVRSAGTTGANGAPPAESVSEESSLEAKLALSERTCEIYRHQIRYMQDQMQNLRIIIQDKENVIDNLILRYDLGDIPSVDQTEDEQLASFDINAEELRKKSEALAQRTMLENFELREMLTDLRDENFQLRHEVFELSDRLNRTKLQLANVTAKAAMAAKPVDEMGRNESPPKKTMPQRGAGGHMRDESAPIPDLQFEADDGLESDEEDAVDDPKAVAKRKERERRDSLKAPDLFGPAMTPDAVKVRQERAAKAHRRDSSAPVPSGLLPLDDDDSDSEGDSGNKRRGSVEDIDHANTEEARAIRAARAEKHHKRDSSVPIPNMYERSDSSDDDEEGTKRRGSVSKLKDSDEAQRIRAERAAKHHKRDSSAAIPDLFGDAAVDPEYASGRRDSYIDPANTAEAQRIRAEREAAKHHKRDSSIPTPNIFAEDAMEIINKKSDRARADGKRDSIVTPNIFGEENDGAMTADAIAIREAREQQRAEHRRDSSVAVPDMFAEDYDERLAKQQARSNKKRDSFVTPNIFDEHPSQTAEAIEIREARAAKHHKRVSSIPTPNIFADNADERLEIQAQRAAKRRESFTTPNLFADDAEDVLQKRAERAQKMTRKRDSLTTPDLFGDDRRNTPEAIAKRKEREERAAAKRNSLITPSIFQNDPSMTPEAIRKRLERQARAHHRKLSSQAAPDLFAAGDLDDQGEVATKHARRQSREVLMRKAGDAGHFSDPETESTNKKQRVEYDMRRKKRKARKKRELSKAQALEDSHHRRESTIPIPNLHFDSDSEEEKNYSRNEDKMKISALEIELERFVEKSRRLQQELDGIKLGSAVVPSGGLNPLNDDYDPDQDLIMGATTTTGGGPEERMIDELQVELHNAVDSKLQLLQTTSREINRLNHVVGVLLHVFNVKWNTVQRLVEEHERKSER